MCVFVFSYLNHSSAPPMHRILARIKVYFSCCSKHILNFPQICTFVCVAPSFHSQNKNIRTFTPFCGCANMTDYQCVCVYVCLHSQPDFLITAPHYFFMVTAAAKHNYPLNEREINVVVVFLNS